MLPDDLRTQPLLSFWTAGTRFRNPCGADVHPATSEGNGVLAAADTLSGGLPVTRALRRCPDCDACEPVRRFETAGARLTAPLRCPEPPLA